jgi:hypothetical protein
MIEVFVTPAYKMRCETCKETRIGGAQGCDEETDQWFEKHASWHKHSPLVPPRSIVFP